MKAKLFWIMLLILIYSSNAFSQDKGFCPTYVYNGFIKTDTGKKLEINLNILVLLDSTLVGSYYYKPQNGSLKLVGHLNKDKSFNLIERDENDSITGVFNGEISEDRSKASGLWTSQTNEKIFNFELTIVKGSSYWDYIQKNRALFEYNDLKIAIKENEKVLSIDVASQGLNKLPKNLDKLKNIVSINLLGNKFTEFPTVLSQLISLDEISLSSNDISYVGTEIGNLKNLRILIMNNNQLTFLPKELGELTNLLYLEIGNNQLTSLPDEIKYLTSLQELHIERNKLSQREKEKLQRLLPNCVIHF